MNTNINDILVEWAYRVKDGKPNPKSIGDRIVLESVLKDFGWNIIQRDELLKNLTEDDDWWTKLSPEQQADYIKKHPKSQKAQDAKKKEKEKEKEKPKADDSGNETQSQINTVAGDEKEDDNKVKNEVLKHGYNGMEDATGRKPAPGTPGSAFNEITSGEGVKMLEEDESLSEKELAQKIFNQFGSSALGQEQKQTSGISNDDYPDEIIDAINKAVGPKPPHTKKNPQNPEALKKAEKDKAVMSKCIIAARSAKQKHKNSVERASSLQEKGLIGKETKTKTFYGADESIDAQVKVIEEAKSKGCMIDESEERRDGYVYNLYHKNEYTKNDMEDELNIFFKNMEIFRHASDLVGSNASCYYVLGQLLNGKQGVSLSDNLNYQNIINSQ